MLPLSNRDFNPNMLSSDVSLHHHSLERKYKEMDEQINDLPVKKDDDKALIVKIKTINNKY